MKINIVSLALSPRSSAFICLVPPAAVHCYRLHAPNVTERTLPGLVRSFLPEGLMVAHICGRNVEGMLKELNLEKALVKWIADERKKAEKVGNPQPGVRERYSRPRAFGQPFSVCE